MTSDNDSALLPPQPSADSELITVNKADLIECIAKLQYASFPFDGKHPSGEKPLWVERGNSDMQELARRKARETLLPILDAPRPAIVSQPDDHPVFAALYKAEINFTISTFWDGGYNVRLGDHMNGYLAETNVKTWAEVAPWLSKAAAEHFPSSSAALLPPQPEIVARDPRPTIGAGSGATGDAESNSSSEAAKPASPHLPRPSAVLPGKESVGVLAEKLGAHARMIRDARKDRETLGTQLDEEFIDEVCTDIETAASALVSQPHPDGEAPTGAIVNGRILIERLEQHYDFECEGGHLENCAEWGQLKQCFEHLADLHMPSGEARAWLIYKQGEPDIAELEHADKSRQPLTPADREDGWTSEPLYLHPAPDNEGLIEAGARSALDAVRALIRPDTILVAADIKSEKFSRKEIFNALTYLTRTGELVHIGYGKYQSPPAGPFETRNASAAGGVKP